MTSSAVRASFVGSSIKEHHCVYLLPGVVGIPSGSRLSDASSWYAAVETRYHASI